MSENSELSAPRTLADPDTGEVFDLVAVPRRAKYNGGPWIMVMQNAADRLADNPDLTDGDVRIFLKLLGRLDWENYLVINVTQLATELGRSRPKVSNAIKRLTDAGALVAGPRSGRLTTYRLSPDVGWKGTHKGRSALQGEMDRRGWSVHSGGTNHAAEPLHENGF